MATKQNLFALTTLASLGLFMTSCTSPDLASQEADRTEIHPADGVEKVPDNVHCELKRVIADMNGFSLTVDVFTPKAVPHRRPAIVFLHGGSWKGGKPSQFHFYSQLLAEKFGFFCLSVDYRLSGVAEFPAALVDAKCAIRYVRSVAQSENIDPEKIVIAGGSAGAHLSSMVLTTAGDRRFEEGPYEEFKSHANLGILINGEFDMQDLLDKKSLVNEMKAFFGGSPEAKPEIYDLCSSVRHVKPGIPPLLLLHGSLDLCVSHRQSLAFAEATRKQGNEAEVEIFEGKGHAWFNKEPDRSEVYGRMEKFLVERFGLKKTYP